MEPEKQERLVAVARIGAPRGLGGYLRLKSYSGEFGHIKKLSGVTLVRGFSEDGEGGCRGMAAAGDGAVRDSRREGAFAGVRAVVDGFQEGDWGLSVHFAGYDSPEKARELSGLDIVVPISAASPLAENEWYIGELVGLQAFLDSEKVGEVTGVLEGGADPLLELRVFATGRTFLVPFRSQFVGKIDKAAGSLELLAGWLLE